MNEREGNNSVYENLYARDPIFRFFRNNRKQVTAAGATGVTLVIAGIVTNAKEVIGLGNALVDFSLAGIGYSYLRGNAEQALADGRDLIMTGVNKVRSRTKTK